MLFSLPLIGGRKELKGDAEIAEFCLMHNDPAVQVCDARDDDWKTTADLIKKRSYGNS
jgi:hypothetical protein